MALALAWRWRSGGGLGVAAMSYLAVEYYVRHISPIWHQRLQPTLWLLLALIVAIRVPSYKHWSIELRSALPFIASMLFMLAALLFEALSVRSVTAVLGLDWHSQAHPLPDTGQWLLLSLVEKMPLPVTDLLRASIVGLHHYLMLFVMLAFSVLFDSVKAPGLGLGARYMFTMGVGRLLRALSFSSTILPSARPWCALYRFGSVPAYPHRWAQKYYMPYVEADAVGRIISEDRIPYAHIDNNGDDLYLGDYQPVPDWGVMSFLIDFLRPTGPTSTWYSLLKKAGGGCNDLLYSGHMLVAVLTAMAWTEAYGGFTSVLIWLLVAHSAQREIRERHHYTVDCVVAIYVGIFLWRITAGFLWPPPPSPKDKIKDLMKLLSKLQGQGRLIQAAKDADIEDEVTELLKEVDEESSQGSRQSKTVAMAMWLFPCTVIFITLTIVILAFALTSDG